MGVLNYSNGDLQAVVEYTISQDVQNNRSTITINHIGFKTTGQSLGTARAEGWLKVGGQQAAYWNYYDGNTMTTCALNNGSYGYIERASAYHSNAVTLAHNADGSCTASFQLCWALTSFSGNTVWGSATQTAYVNLPATIVPQATRPVLNIGTTQDSPVELGSTMKITLSPNMDSLRHTLVYRLAGVDYGIAGNLSGGAHGWTAPYSIAALFQTLVIGYGQIICRTYLNGAQVGGDQAVSFYFRVPDNDTTKPKITAFSIRPEVIDGTIPEKFSGLYIQNVSRIRGDITAEGPYSPVRYYQLAGTGISGDAGVSSPVYGFASNSGKISVLGRVTDYRGFQRDAAREITVYAYSNPSLSPRTGNAVVCARCDAAGGLDENGTHLRIEARRSCSPITVDGVNLNTCAMDYRYREAAADGFGEWIALSGDDVMYTSGAILDLKHTYVVQIRVLDEIGRSTVAEFPIPSDRVTFHMKNGGRGAAFFKRAEIDGALEVAGDVILSEGKTLTLGSTQLTESQLKSLLALIK